MLSFKERFNLPLEYLEAIGQITCNFSLLEQGLIIAFSQLISDSNSELIKRLVAADFFNVLISKFKKLSIYMIDQSDLIADKEKQQIKMEIKTFCASLGNLSDDRDKILHSLWYIDNDGTIKRTKYKKNINIDPDIVDIAPVTVESLRNFAKKILQLFESLHDLRKKIIKLLSP